MTVKEFVEMVERDTIIINAQTGRKVGDWSDFQEWKVKNHKGQKTRVYLRLGVDKIRPRWYNYFGGKGKTALGEKI